MRVIVLSDTHKPVSGGWIPEALLNDLKAADLIIHVGDATEESVLDELKEISPVEAVAGNMDSPALKKANPIKKILQLGKFKVGLIHGEGSPSCLQAYVQRIFRNDDVDCIIYGHSHVPCIEEIDGRIYMNPGSSTDEVFAPYRSYGVLEIGDEITPKIIRL
ncbi:metallophosphoesterase family protein [Candidatus Omnitrophota bacterium]